MGCEVEGHASGCEGSPHGATHVDATGVSVLSSTCEFGCDLSGEWPDERAHALEVGARRSEELDAVYVVVDDRFARFGEPEANVLGDQALQLLEPGPEVAGVETVLCSQCEHHQSREVCCAEHTLHMVLLSSEIAVEAAVLFDVDARTTSTGRVAPSRPARV